jgi:DNA invertase Pin-like site-specific DNA recombinase
MVGYARVSTDGQSLDAQHAALTVAGAEKVFAEKISGAVTDRKALQNRNRRCVARKNRSRRIFRD